MSISNTENDRDVKTDLLNMGGLILTACILLSLFVIFHERVHEDIFHYHGFEQTDVTYNTFLGVIYGGGTTARYTLNSSTTEGFVFISNDDSAQVGISRTAHMNMWFLHSLNEVLSYPLIVFMFSMYIFLMFQIILR